MVFRRGFLRSLGLFTLGTISGCSSIESPTNTPRCTRLSNVPESSTKLVPDAVDRNDAFGRSVALSADGSTALIGAPKDGNSKSGKSGAAYVFGQDNGGWKQHAKLVPADADEGDRFGQSVAVSGDGETALVSAFFDEDPNGSRSGSVYVFTNNEGRWSQQAKLVPTDGDPGDTFGIEIALSKNGTMALVGAPSDDTANGDGAGSAYVFEQTGGRWQQEIKLAPTDGGPNDEFGGAVALSSRPPRALIGAWRTNRATDEFVGSAYVFSKDTDSWTLDEKLVPREATEDAFFGGAVALSKNGGTAVVGAFGDESPSGDRSGSAYVYSRGGEGWEQEHKLTPEEGNSHDYFGGSIAVYESGPAVIVGARNDEEPNGTEAGSAYGFTKTNDGWRQQAKLVPEDGASYDHFGNSVAIANDRCISIIGSPGDDNPNGSGAGSAYIFEP